MPDFNTIKINYGESVVKYHAVIGIVVISRERTRLFTRYYEKFLLRIQKFLIKLIIDDIL